MPVKSHTGTTNLRKAKRGVFLGRNTEEFDIGARIV